MDAFPMEECLADPKLAAEFINAVLPGDEWLLALLYSIEEYECMLTTDPLPSLETQITTTMAIIDRFLTPTTPRPQYDALEIMGKELKHVVTQFQLPEHTSGGSLPTVLPKILFDSVYTTVYDILRDAYDSQFRAAWEYRQLLSEAKQQEQMRWQREGQQLLVLTFDQVLESEWCCTVFWVYLFRTSHHYRLSFIMDIKYKLRRLWSTTQDLPSGSTEAKEAYKRLVHELELLCHRYLSSKMASVALPMTSALLTKLKDEICGDIRELRLCSKSSGNLDLIRRLSRIIEKLDTMHTQTRAEFKRVSLERFTNFLASSLYRDFILHPISSSSMDCSRSEDLMQLLRVNRIPFHQTPAMPPNPPTLTHLLADLGPDHCEGAFHHGIAGLFAFQGIRLATLTGSEGVVRPRSSRLEYRHWYSSPDETEATRLTLCKSSEHFLLPETTPASFSLEEACRWPPVCFNFLSGTGDKTVYGAVWRFGAEGSDTEDSTRAIQGVCVLSRFPLVDSLREILKEIASSIQPGSDLFAMGQDHTAGLVKMAQSAFSMNLAHFSIPEEPQRLPPIDFSLQDLFECLSITHIMRLFAFVLQEKKLVLVSSSYSVLFSVGTALQTLLSPLLWAHVYVPVLPMGMKCYLHCPTPFIFGLHTSYARHCELPKPSDDLVVVNLDRDSLTGGGDVALPPLRANSLREKLVRACKPRLQTRDQVAYAPKDWEVPLKFPSVLVRRAFREELDDILRHLETFAFRFECSDRLISVVDTSNKSRQWPVDTARFYTAILQSQAFSTYVGSSLS
ncbi:hypothetical protein Poli38472_008269 [Pythium oligandrum]|uniref:UDENN domain-containing protein n=1 Tax=Pythium oligandrum TaxID=41045 RepID=A0A8K1FN90_PYTOL|nr:hypothetical protein Poli38472_008269 [Pythium oligandrum]|eukprot:TMW65627.1 hypothetical protein Poli38472_008269 [Pythium oligandrum]